ncbi:unnamed protein product, partial [Discosporangium mesarthrocarpum]
CVPEEVVVDSSFLPGNTTDLSHWHPGGGFVSVDKDREMVSKGLSGVCVPSAYGRRAAESQESGMGLGAVRTMAVGKGKGEEEEVHNVYDQLNISPIGSEGTMPDAAKDEDSWTPGVAGGYDIPLMTTARKTGHALSGGDGVGDVKREVVDATADVKRDAVDMTGGVRQGQSP